MKKYQHNHKKFNLRMLAMAVSVALVGAVSSQAVANSGSNTSGGSTASGTTNGGSNSNIPRSPKVKSRKIGDMEIYQSAKGGTPVLTLMLDRSASMGFWHNDTNNNGVVDKVNGKKEYYIDSVKEDYEFKENEYCVRKQQVFDYTIPFTDAQGKELQKVTLGLWGCGSGINDPNLKLDRFSRLKKALFEVFANGQALPAGAKIGIGHFPEFNAIDNKVHNSMNAQNSGSIQVPTKTLTNEHRLDIIKYLQALAYQGGTPIASAYAEVGAYMLGSTTTLKDLGQQNTSISPVWFDVGYLAKQPNGKWRPILCSGNVAPLRSSSTVIQNRYNCGNFSAPVLTLNDFFERFAMKLEYDNPDQIPAWLERMFVGDKKLYMSDFTSARSYDNYNHPDVRYVVYMRKLELPPLVLANSRFNVPFSGFWLSNVQARKKIENQSAFVYDSPISDKGATTSTNEANDNCSGYGVYFLTDGAPNSAGIMSTTAEGYIGPTDRNPIQKIFDYVINYGQNPPSLGQSYLNQGTYWQMRPDDSLPLINGYHGSDGWDYIGAFAKYLSEPQNFKRHPELAQKTIRTVTVGFGSVYTSALKDEQTKDTVLGNDGVVRFKTDDEIGELTGRVLKCDTLTKQNARNLCHWGMTFGGNKEAQEKYPGMGFLATSHPTVLKNDFLRFVYSLNQDVGSQPAGTISIPTDPLNISSIQPYAYLPMVEPQIGSTDTIWQGNLKKYHTINGTLYAKDGTTKLYKTASNATSQNIDYPFATDSSAADVWSDVVGASNGDVDVGGARSKLQHPKADSKDNVRFVYVESLDSVSQKPTLVKVGIKNGQLQGFGQLDGRYSASDWAYLVNFLGYNIDTNVSSTADVQTKLTQAYNAGQFSEQVVLGGVVHSAPTLASYSGKFTETGVSSRDEDRDDRLVYGSMDGALHMVKSSDGTETFAFIPRAMFDRQKEALKFGTQNARGVGEPVFGVDAPWLVNAAYEYDFDTKGQMFATKMATYGGLRMGGVGIYGLDIIDAPQIGKEPNKNISLKFAIDHKNKDAKGYGRLGQIWSRPSVITIKTGASVTDKKEVLVFGGGYDMCYEEINFKLKTGAAHKADANDATNCDVGAAAGNAVYIMNPEDGELLAEFTAPKAGGVSANSDDRDKMLHSVVGGITVLDGNNDGMADFLYFADLGGQVFRIDLQQTLANSRVVRVFDANKGKETDTNHVNYRFFEQPIVSFYDDEQQNRFAVVNVASGDRSSPYSAERAITSPNRIYGIFDRDLATVKLTSSQTQMADLSSRNIGAQDLQEIDPKEIQKLGQPKAKELLNNMQESIATYGRSNTPKQGWYYNMTLFDSYVDVPNLKAVGPGAVTGSIYYASIYSPDYQYDKPQKCSASIRGGTERQLYCLPWGICAVDRGADKGKIKGTKDSTGGTKGTNGVFGYVKAGPGIQELAFGTVTDTVGQSRNFKALIGHQQLIGNTGGTSGGRPDYALSNPNNAFAGMNSVADGEKKGGIDSTEQPITSEGRVLKVARWYDLQNAEHN